MSGANKTVLSAGTSLEPEVPKCDNLQDWKISSGEIVDNAWLAGIIDGEGSITLAHSCNRIYARLCIENTDPRMIQRISRILERQNIKFCYGYTNRENKRETLMIMTTGFGSTQKALQMVLPYLTAKTEQAVCLLRFIAWRQSITTRPVPKYAEETEKTREELYKLKRVDFNIQRLSRAASKTLILD